MLRSDSEELVIMITVSHLDTLN